MCDYSLHAVASRAAEATQTLILIEFKRAFTRGFASPDDPTVAVCLLPGTEIEFEREVRVRGFIFQRKVHDRMARFRQVHVEDPHRHHDALEFSNGMLVMVNDLACGQSARVLQLPAHPSKYHGPAQATSAKPAKAEAEPHQISVPGAALAGHL